MKQSLIRIRITAIRVTLMTIAAIALCACNQTVIRPQRNYETIGKDPKRDTELARRKNAEAIEQIHQSKYPEAEKLLKDSLDADVTFGPAHNNLGKVYYHQNEFYLAAWEFQYAAKLMPDMPEPRNNLGLVLESVGKLDEAVSSYDEAVKLRPDNAQFLGNDARARYQRGDRDEKLHDMLEALALRDNRMDWSQWAREQLSRMGGSATRP